MPRHRTFKPGAGGGVGVEISRNVDPAFTRSCDARNRFGHQLAPTGSKGGLEVEYLDLGAAFLANADGLVDAMQQPRAFVAHMRGIKAAATRRDLGQSNQVVGRLEGIGRIHQRGADPEHPRLHCGIDQRAHLVELGWRRCARSIAHDLSAGLRRTVIGAEIDRDAAFHEVIKILWYLARRNGRPAFASDDRRHTHAQLVFCRALFQKHAARLVHHIDEAGGHIFSVCVNLCCARRGDSTDLCDPAVLDTDIRINPWVSCTVENAATLDDDVIVRRRRRSE